MLSSTQHHPSVTDPQRKYSTSTGTGTEQLLPDASADKSHSATMPTNTLTPSVAEADTYTVNSHPNQEEESLLEEVRLPEGDCDISLLPHEGLPLTLLYRERLLPLNKNDSVLHLGCDKDLTYEQISRLKFITGRSIVRHRIDSGQLNKWLNIHARLNKPTSDTTLPDADTVADADTFPAHYLKGLAHRCLLQRGSDIHFEPNQRNYQIRIRIDGRLKRLDELTLIEGERCLLRLKLLAGMDIGESRLPQDGAITLLTNDRSKVSFRAATLPTIHGEKLTLRLLDSVNVSLRLDQLGMQYHQLHAVKAALDKSRGLILVCGPTGSGKTSTLYSALMHINRTTRNVISAENPVEHHLPGVQQVQIDQVTGLSFATALRAFLRQDPDVIMIGEVRDEETADITLKAVQTGHLVLATVHADSAYGCWSRLQQLGISKRDLNETLTLVIAQRLIPTRCPHCHALPTPLSTSGIKYQIRESSPYTHPAKMRIPHADCPYCHEGKLGRAGIFDVHTVPFEFPEEMDMEGAMQGLRKAGMALVAKGMVAEEDLLNVL